MADFLSHWRGVLLSLVGIVATVWLAVTNQLGLYIHPRYFIFTVVMAAIAAVFVVLNFSMKRVDGEHDHEHEHPRSKPRRTLVGINVVLIAAVAFGLLVLPPATLTTSTVQQRDMNGSVAAASESTELVGADFDAFTVRDWAGVLRQSPDESFFAGTTPIVEGFITPDADDPENVFYVARFVVTCCAVDAQPIGVPVYSPGWQDSFEVDDWVRVTGSFVSNPSVESAQALVIAPADIVPIKQPQQPYVF